MATPCSYLIYRFNQGSKKALHNLQFAQTKAMRKNGEKTAIGLISKKSNFAHAAHVHFFAIVLHNYNVKLPETS